MKKSELSYFRKVLNDWQEQLLWQADHAIVDLMDASVNSSDLIDQTALEIDRNFALRMRDRESKLIRKIKNALKRIDDGTFGICEMCGGPIAVKRLKARPVTTHCIDCKRVRETFERLTGD